MGKFIDNEFVVIFYFGLFQLGINDNEENFLLFLVKWIKFYFDCGWFNKWIVIVSVFVVEYMFRYFDFIYLRRFR